MSLYDINISKIKFTSKGHSNSLKDIISGVPISKDYINKLYELGFKITNSEEFEVYLNILSISNNNILYRIRDINKLRGIFKDDDVVRTLCTEKIKNSLHSKMYSNYFELIDVKNELKDSDEWIAILDSLRSQTSLYDLRTKKSKQDSGYNSYSFTNTVEYFNELKCDKSYIEKMGGVGKFTNNVFEGSKVDDILSFFKSNGYTINREIELEIIENSINRAYKNEKYLDKDGKENTKKVYSEEYYQRLLDRNINIEESLEHILEYIRTRIEITDSEISKYKEIFNKGESKWISILDNEFKIIRHTQFKYSAIKELSRRNIYDVSNYKDWYNKYFDIYPTIENKIHRWDKFENDLKVLYIIASLDKFNEVDKLNINFDITTDNMRGFSFDDNKFHSISKLLCRTGSDYDRNFKDFNLPSHKLKMIYEWILSKVDMKEVTVNKYLLVCHYIYNKDIYLKCLIDFKKKRRGILRVSLYRYILLLFAKNNNIIEYKKILNDLFSLVDSDIKNTKMLPIEYKKTINYLDSIGNRDFSKLVDPYLLEIKSKYDRILNESIITKFKYFR